MKKNILRAVFVVALVLVAIYNYRLNEQEHLFSELALENIEALASNENSSSCSGGGVANVRCPIWQIKYSVGFTGPNIECMTGGTYKCEKGTCPHGK